MTITLYWILWGIAITGLSFHIKSISYPTYKKIGSFHRPSVLQFIFLLAKSKPFVMC